MNDIESSDERVDDRVCIRTHELSHRNVFVHCARCVTHNATDLRVSSVKKFNGKKRNALVSRALGPTHIGYIQFYFIAGVNFVSQII